MFQRKLSTVALFCFFLLPAAGCDDGPSFEVVASAKADPGPALKPDDAAERDCLDACEGKAGDALETCKLNCTATDEDLHESTVPTLIERLDACSMSCDAYDLTGPYENTCDELCVAREIEVLSPCTHDCAMNFMACEDSCDDRGEEADICELGCSLGGETCVAICGPVAFLP